MVTVLILLVLMSILFWDVRGVHHHSTFVIKNDKRCLHPTQGVPLRVRASKCTPLAPPFYWRWTKDGQLQNVHNNLCIDVDYDQSSTKLNSKLRMSKCFYNKVSQKLKCDKNSVIAAHSRQHRAWVFDKKGYGRLAKPSKKLSEMKIAVGPLSLCDMNYKESCLQTVGKIPSAPEAQCVVAVTSDDGEVSYAEVPVTTPSKTIKDFTLTFWFKAPPNNMGQATFSYVDEKQLPVLSFIAVNGISTIGLYGIFYPYYPWQALTNTWTHVGISMNNGKLYCYVNGDELNLRHSGYLNWKVLPNKGTLYLGVVNINKVNMTYSGYISRFNIYTEPWNSEKFKWQSTKVHCMSGVVPGDWLNWDDIWSTMKMNGLARKDVGTECIAFEDLTSGWTTQMRGQLQCRTSLKLSDESHMPSRRFTASSTSKGHPSNGRAAITMPRPWCSSSGDLTGYLQVDLGKPYTVTAIGVARLKNSMKLYVDGITLRYSRTGIWWETDEQVYDAKVSKPLPHVEVIPLVTSAVARFLRFFPIGCTATQCCLSVEAYGCEKDIQRRSFGGEDGCVSYDKPFALMDLGKLQRIRRVQISLNPDRTETPIKQFYFYYLSHSSWVPYQVDKKTKIFRGASGSERPNTYILPYSIVTNMVKIYPVHVPSGKACSKFSFIGCPISRDEFCDGKSYEKKQDCDPSRNVQCKLGLLGDPKNYCQDLDECGVKGTSYCDQNSVCKNLYGSYECTPCTNGFIGDGNVCGTSCEILGVFCGNNSHCDINECVCDEGYILNGTRCEEEIEEEPTVSLEAEAVGVCSDGYYSCYGDVLGALEKLKRAVQFYTRFDENEPCD